MKITILGTGAYGLSLSYMFYQNNCDITMWTKFDDERLMLEKKRVHKLLPSYKIPNSIKFSSDLKEAVKDAEIIVIAVPAGYVDDICKELKHYVNLKTQHFCIGSKGIEQDTCLFVNEVFNKYIKTKKLAVISGATFAVDLVQNVPLGMSLASKNDETIDLLKQSLQNDYLKLRPTKDILGIEICGSIKNVIAIASGMLDGLGTPIGTQAMFITESLHDIKNLIKALGGNKKTILSYAGFGDLLMTCTSTKSRNFMFGQLLGQKTPHKKVMEYLDNTTVEGLYTLKSIYKLLDKKKVNMPIIDLIYDIIFKDKKPEELLIFLIEKE